MIKGFRTKRELKDYLYELDSFKRSEFVNELIMNVRYFSLKYQEYKAKIHKALYEEFYDVKNGVLHIWNLAKDALYSDMKHNIDFELEDIDYTDDEIISIYNQYLEISYKSNIYFSRIFSLSAMFASMAYAIGDFPQVEGIIVGVYNGRNNGYNANEFKSKYFTMIFDIINSFENEWIKLNKFDLYKLK